MRLDRGVGNDDIPMAKTGIQLHWQNPENSNARRRVDTANMESLSLHRALLKATASSLIFLAATAKRSFAFCPSLNHFPRRPTAPSTALPIRRVVGSPDSQFVLRRRTPPPAYVSASDSPETFTSVTSAAVPSSSAPSRLRILKDKMWLRETNEDLTAAEFATRLENLDPGDLGGSEGPSDRNRPRTRGGRAVDYPSILSKLDLRIDALCPGSVVAGAALGEPQYVEAEGWARRGDRSVWTGLAEALTESVALVSGRGAGSVVLADAQREELLRKIQDVRSKVLIAAAKVNEMHFSDDLSTISPTMGTTGTASHFTSSKENNVAAETGDMMTTVEQSEEGPTIYVRDDGTIDWDGALSGAEALKTFGVSIWARINGRQEEDADLDSVAENNTPGGKGGHAPAPAVTAEVEETEAIRTLRIRLEELQKDFREMELRHTELLNSAVRPGTAVANVKLAAIEPELRFLIQNSESNLAAARDNVNFQSLRYDLERIFVYLDGEMAGPSARGYIPLQDRLAVAEFGLLESQVNALSPLFNENGPAWEGEEGRLAEHVDVDVLPVIIEQVADLKRRLGIDFQIQGVTFDADALRMWAGGALEKSVEGVAFYGKGCQLLWNDVKFSASLLSRALNGYTLKPREVRNLRRTFRDIITFIPVVIIFLIPISPIGHVLVFGAIQRVFPEFFPSCFTESRQNLLQLYESTEYTEVKFKEGFSDKLRRAIEAIIYIIVDAFSKIMDKLRNMFGEDAVSEEDAEV